MNWDIFLHHSQNMNFGPKWKLLVNRINSTTHTQTTQWCDLSQ